MGFLETLKETITNKPSNLREPSFIKEFNEDNKQLNDLQEFLKIAPKEVVSDIEQDVKLLSYGLIGERNVAYELKNSHMPILILHNLYLNAYCFKSGFDYNI